MFRRGKKKSEGSSSAATPERKKKGRMFRKANKNKQRYEEEPREAANDYDYETGLPEFPPGSNDGSERNVDLDADIDHSSGMDDEFGYVAQRREGAAPRVGRAPRRRGGGGGRWRQRQRARRVDEVARRAHLWR